MTTLESRIARLEQHDEPAMGVSDRMRLAALRWRAMSADERAAERQARVQRALEAPEPAGRLSRALWRAARRLVLRVDSAPADALADGANH